MTGPSKVDIVHLEKAIEKQTKALAKFTANTVVLSQQIATVITLLQTLLEEYFNRATVVNILNNPSEMTDEQFPEQQEVPVRGDDRRADPEDLRSDS